MAPLPKKRHSTRRKGKRRAAIKLTLPKLIACPNCHELIRTHMTCPHCGLYKGTDILNLTKADENKKRPSTSQAGTNR